MSTGFFDATEGELGQRMPLLPTSDVIGEVFRRDLSFLLNNDPAGIALVVEQLRRQMTSRAADDRSAQVAVTLALEEALANALFHGNLEISSKLREGDGRAFHKLARKRRRQLPYRDRRISVIARLAHQEMLIVVRDDGRGFDTSKLPDPRDGANLSKPSGRGVLLMRHLMDDVRFNPRGNEVRMTKRFSSKTP